MFLERRKAMVKLPAEMPPWFFTVLVTERVDPALTVVVPGVTAVMIRSGFVTLIVEVVHLVLFVSLLSLTVPPLSAFEQI